MASRLEVTGLQKTYGSRRVVSEVHLAVGAGEVVGLLGPNGAGKSTLVKILVTVVRPDQARGRRAIRQRTGCSCCRDPVGRARSL